MVLAVFAAQAADAGGQADGRDGNPPGADGQAVGVGRRRQGRQQGVEIQ